MVVVHGLLIAVVFPCESQAVGLNRLQELWCMGSLVVAQGFSCSMACWVLLDKEITPMFPALAGRFLTTGNHVSPIIF